MPPFGTAFPACDCMFECFFCRPGDTDPSVTVLDSQNRSYVTGLVDSRTPPAPPRGPHLIPRTRSPPPPPPPPPARVRAPSGTCSSTEFEPAMTLKRFVLLPAFSSIFKIRGQVGCALCCNVFSLSRFWQAIQQYSSEPKCSYKKYASSLQSHRHTQRQTGRAGQPAAAEPKVGCRLLMKRPVGANIVTHVYTCHTRIFAAVTN